MGINRFNIGPINQKFLGALSTGRMHIVTNINTYCLNYVKPSPVAQSLCFDSCCTPLTHFVDTVMPGVVDKLSDGQLVGQGAVRKLELVSMGYRY